MKNYNDKAIELINLFLDENYFSNDEILKNAKDNAKICVKQIVKSWEEDGNKRLDASIIHYWKEVEKAIDLIEEIK